MELVKLVWNPAIGLVLTLESCEYSIVSVYSGITMCLLFGGIIIFTELGMAIDV